MNVNVDQYFYLYYVDSYDYVEIVADKIYSMGGYLIDYNLIETESSSEDITPQLLSNYELMIEKAITFLPTNGVIYIIGNDLVMPFIKVLFKMYCQIKKSLSFFIYGANMRYIFDNMPEINQPIVFYALGNDITDFANYFPSYPYEIDNYLDPPVMEVFYALAIIVNIYDGKEQQYNTNDFMKYAFETTIYNLSFNPIHYLSQKLAFYKVTIAENYKKTVENVFTRNIIKNHVPMYDYDEENSLCVWENVKGTTISIGLVFSFSGEKVAVDIPMYLNAALYLMDGNLNPFMIGDNTYYLNPVVVDIRSDNENCENAFVIMRNQGVKYIFGLYRSCFHYLESYPDMVLFYPRMSTGTTCQKNVVFTGGLYQQLYKKVPSILHHRNITSIILIGSSEYEIRNMFNRMSDYLFQFFKSNQTIFIQKEHNFFSDIFQSLEKPVYDKTALILSLNDVNMEEFINYWETKSNLHQYYLPLFFRLSEDYIMKRKPPFDMSIFTFYTNTFDSEENEYYKRSIENTYGTRYSSQNGESGYNAINIFVQIAKKVKSIDTDVIMSRVFEEEYTSPEGDLLFSSEGYLRKNVFYVEYDHLTQNISLTYQTEAIYPEARAIANNETEYIKGSFCNGTIGEIYHLPYYEVMLYLGSDETELYLLKQFVALYGLFDDIIYHYCLNFVYNNYTIDVSGIFFSYSPNIYSILSNALKRETFLALFIANYDEVIKNLNSEIKDNSKLIFFLSPNEPGFCDRHILYFDGIDRVLLEHTIEMIHLQKSGMIDDIIVIYQNSTQSIRRKKYLIDAIYFYFNYLPKYVLSINELQNGTIYDFRSIENCAVLTPNGIEDILTTLVDFVDVDNFNVIVFFYRDNMINPFNFNVIAYVTTFSEEGIAQRNEAISKLEENFNVYEIEFDYYYGSYENVASLAYAYSLFTVAVYQSYIENAITSDNIHKHLLSFRENINGDYFIGANNYALMNYYLVVMREESNMTFAFSNYYKQNPYDSDFYYCDWREKMVENATYNNIINVAIVYTNTKKDVIFDPQALPVFLYEVDYCNANFEIGDNYFKAITRVIDHDQSCGSIIKDLIENYNVRYIFGGLFAECRQSVHTLLNDSSIDFLFFFNGEVDEMICDKHIINLGPTPTQITDIIVKETGLTHKGFIIIYSSTSLYSCSLQNFTYSTLYTFGFDVYSLNESQWRNVSQFLDIDTIDNLISDYVIVNELNFVEDIIEFLSIVKLNTRIFEEVEFVHLSIDDNFLNQLKSLYNLDYQYLPIRSYFITNFFADLFSLTNDFTRFDVKFDKHMLLLLQKHLGVTYFLTTLSSQTYLAFEMFKNMIRFLQSTNVAAIRLSLYQRGFLGPAGAVVLQYNNYLAMRMYFGKYDWTTQQIKVIQSPNDFILPHNYFSPLDKCDCSKEILTDYISFYHLIMVFEHWNVTPYITVALTFFNTISNYNIDENSGAGVNGRIIIPHLYFARFKNPEDSFMELVYTRNVIALVGCYTIRCGVNVGDVADAYHIPFFYFGPYCHTYTPYTFFISPHLDTIVKSTVSYLEKLNIFDMIIMDGDYSIINSTNYKEEVMVNGSLVTRKTNKYLLKLFDNYTTQYNSTINLLDYYSVSNNSQLHEIMQRCATLTTPTVVLVLLNGPVVNTLLMEYEEIKNINPSLIFMFLYYNYYIIENKYKYLLQGHLAVSSYVMTSSNIDSMTFYLRIENNYGTPIVITDGIVNVAISLDYITTTIQVLISDLIYTSSSPTSYNNKNDKYLGDYMKMESYYVNVTSPLGVVSITFGNQLRGSISMSELSDTGTLKLLNVYETSENTQEEYFYGPERKYLEIDKTSRIVIICLFVLQIIFLLFSGYGIYYFSKKKPSKIMKNYGTNYFYVLLFCNGLMTLLSVFHILNHSKLNCFVKADSTFIVYSFTYGIILFKYHDIKRVAQNKYISRIRINWWGYILNAIILEVIVIILIIIWNTTDNFGLVNIHSETDSTLFETVYIMRCDYYGVGFGIMIGVIILILLVDIRISWDLRFLSDYYLFTSVLVSIILLIVISVLLTLIVSLSDKMFALDYLLWSYMLFVMAFSFWISIFIRIYTSL